MKLSFISVGLGLLTLAIVSRASKPSASKGRRAVWRSIQAREGSWYFAEPGWLGWWTIVEDGEIINETRPTV